MDEVTFRQVLSELKQLPAQAGLNLNDLLVRALDGDGGEVELGGETRRLLTWLVRLNRFTTAEVAEHLEQTPRRTRRLLQTLEERGYLRSERSGRQKQYHLRLQTAHAAPANRRRQADTLWQILGDENTPH